MFIKNRIINDSYWTYPYLVYASEPSYVYARKCVLFIIQWRPGMDRLIGIQTTFFQSQIFSHSHNVLSDSESGLTCDSRHGPPFFGPES